MSITISKHGTAPLYALCAAAAFLLIPGRSWAQVELHPKQIGAAIDYGQVKVDGPEDDQILTRTGVYLTVSGTYNRKLDVRLTTGGLFWYPFPEQATPDRIVRFGPGVGEAQAIYSFGNPDHPSSQLRFGLFPEKYSDSKNLGEYLYRSGTYPGYLWTGGWSYVNAANYMAQGVKFTLPTFGGKVTHDFTLFMERDIEPTNDLSPGYRITVKPTPFLQFGAGVVWSHAIPLNPDSVLTPRLRINAYDKGDDQPLSFANRVKPGYVYYGPGDPRNDTMIVANTADPRWKQLDSQGRMYVVAGGNEELGQGYNGSPRNQLGYYTFKGFKTMAQASMDIGSILGVEGIHPGDFKIYGEIALLGVEDQPFFYDHKLERMPMMLGINIPTFGLLNQLSVEMEYHKSRFQNTVAIVYDQDVPLPLDAGDNPYAYTDSAVSANEKTHARDDWKWSVYASRKITDGITLYAQAANDNSRFFNPEVKPSNTPLTVKPKDWYYVVRLDFGLF